MKHIYLSGVAIVLVLSAGLFGLSRAFSAKQIPIKTIVVPISSASVSLAMSSSSPRATLAINISDIVPGQSITREVTITNTGTVGLAGIYLRASISSDSLLFSPGGIHLAVLRCSRPPIKLSSTFACPAASTVASRPLSKYGQATTVANGVASGVSVYLVFTFSLPTSASNSYANQTAGVSWQFEGVS